MQHLEDRPGPIPSVLFVILEFSDRMRGGSRSLKLILKRLRRCVAHVICYRDGELYQTLKSDGIPTTLLADFRDNPYYRIRARRSFHDRFRLGMALLRSNLQVFKFMRGAHLRIIHCNSIYDFFHSFLGAKLAGAQIVFNVRGTHPRDRMKWHWQIPLLISAKVIVLSDEMRRYYIDRVWPFYRGRAARNTIAIYSGVEFEDVEVYKEGREHYRQNLGLPPHGPVVVYIGAIHEVKNQFAFIQNVALPVSLQLPEICFCFVGDIIESDPESAAYRDACFQLIDELQLGSHIRFVGHQSPLYPWLLASDFSALASTAEGLPRVMIESLACCRPVVMTAVTSAREILEKHQCGFVVSHGDWEAMTNRILELSSNADLRSEMSIKAGQAARRLFDPDLVAREYEGVYAELASLSS